MAKLFEYQGKELLKRGGIATPAGRRATSKQDVADAARGLGGPVVIKAQTWTTGRAQSGGVLFADSPDEAASAAEKVIGARINGFSVQEVLVEEKLDIDREFYCGMIIDDAAQCPILIFSSRGGTGIEEIARTFPDSLVKYPVDVINGIRNYHALDILRMLDIRGELQKKLGSFLAAFYRTCRGAEARSAEINPLVLTKQGQIVAADCHIVIDDYAVFRHPELGIEIAREFDRPATALERVAYAVEAKDHRGTFYFFQMQQQTDVGERLVGFHGAGGGGSMMSMDALTGKGFKLANFCDTSGNPSASKVYRAATIILSQKNIGAYFASGSGVASQEQFHSARGLVKAFREKRLSVPAVIRLGGNSEQLAIEILHTYTKDLPCKVEAYGRDTPAVFCAERLRQLVDSWDYGRPEDNPEPRSLLPSDSYGFVTITGKMTIDHAKCADCTGKPCIEACSPKILKIEEGRPVLAIFPQDAAKGKCTECLACELACEFHGNGAIYVDLPIHGLDEAVKSGE
ncbi:MAG: ATP-grasp domain-containing protein [Syntrophobacteraceae bacterium]